MEVLTYFMVGPRMEVPEHVMIPDSSITERWPISLIPYLHLLFPGFQVFDKTPNECERPQAIS